MKFLLTTILSGLLIGLLNYAYRLPKNLARVLLLVPILFFGFFAGLFVTGCISALINRNWPLLGLSFAVAVLFLGVVLKLLAVLIGIGREMNPLLTKIIMGIICGCSLIFFTGFLIMLLTGISDIALPLWRQIGLFLIAISGMIGSGVSIFRSVKK